MAKVQIAVRGSGLCHAGDKAPRDAAVVAERCGFRRLTVVRTGIPHNLLDNVYRLLWLLKCQFYRLRVPHGSTVFVQYPSNLFNSRLGLYLFDCVRRRAERIVTLVHDVDALRGLEVSGVREGMEEFLRRIVEASDSLIVHNGRMRTWFVEHGVPAQKMVVLGPFDYLAEGSPARADERVRQRLPIVIAGNLAPEKAGYLAHLGEVDSVDWRLYGPSCARSVRTVPNVAYAGCFPPDELPGRLEGSFGLVWDGSSVETCTGAFGAYLRYNNPHKLSLYLAAGLPVVVWSESALASFVEAEGVGFGVSSLRELSERLASLEAARYAAYRANARRLSEEVRRGARLSRVLSAIGVILKDPRGRNPLELSQND